MEFSFQITVSLFERKCIAVLEDIFQFTKLRLITIPPYHLSSVLVYVH